MFKTVCHKMLVDCSPRAHLRIIAVIIMTSACVGGCKRVPSERVFVPQAMSAIEAGKKRSHTQHKKERTEELGDLCMRACDNWLDHQFVVPVSYDDQRESLQEVVDSVIDSQRQRNRDTCVSECQRRADRPKARCIASAPSILDIDDCRFMRQQR
ncbi:MAG: hypothetical protein VX223_08685 [Myxococcota bacterium]|nr:hypothetical protein [Myxococcota bacterium]